MVIDISKMNKKDLIHLVNDTNSKVDELNSRIGELTSELMDKEYKLQNLIQENEALNDRLSPKLASQSPKYIQDVKKEEFILNSFSFNNVKMGRKAYGGQKYIRNKTIFTPNDNNTITVTSTYFSHRGYQERFPEAIVIDYSYTSDDLYSMSALGFEGWCRNKFSFVEELDDKNSKAVTLQE